MADKDRERAEFLRSRFVAGRELLEDGSLADAAQAFLMASVWAVDSAERDADRKVAEVCAQLAMRDAIQEATQAVKALASETMDAVIQARREVSEARGQVVELSDTIKKATQVVVIELRKAQVKAA